MEIARALILALSSAADPPWTSVGSGPKPLVPVATKPILFHTLEALHRAGVVEVTLLTEPASAPAFRAAVGDGSRWDMRIAHTASDGVTSLPSALGAARDFIDGEPVLVQRADALLGGRLRDHVVGFARNDLEALALLFAGARAHAPAPRLAGGYLLTPAAISIVLDGLPDGDPLARLRSHGSRVHALDVEGCLACHGGESSLLEANRQALSSIATDTAGVALEGSEIQGPVIIHPSARLRNSLVRGPAIIGPGARLVDSYVGPYTSIGTDVHIEGTEIEHSIVMDGAELLFIGRRLETSIIGRGASIVRRFEIPSAVRMSVGDGAQVAL